MKVLHLIGGDLSGGAAKGAYLLHEGLVNLGVDSRVLTNSKTTYNNKSVVSIAQSKKEKVFCLLRPWLDKLILNYYPSRQKYIFSNNIFGYNFTKHPSYKWADIINLHWINGGFLRIKDISKMIRPQKGRFKPNINTAVNICI